MSRTVEIPDLSIIVPCLNEEENVGDILKALDDVVTPHQLSVEVLLIDDLSDDNTFEVAMQSVPQYPNLHLRVIRRYHPRRGYGAVLRYGMAHARGKYCTFVSADGVDPLHILPDMLNKMQEGTHDLIQCSRYGKEDDHQNLPWKFKVSHFFYRRLVKSLLDKDISDSTYPFRIFDRMEMLGLGIGQNSFSISPEIFFKISLNGGKIFYFSHGQGMRTKGESKFRFRREGIRYGYVLIRAYLHKIGLVLWF